MPDQALIFGAGKIGRGFIAHLLDRSNFKVTYIEASAELVALLNAADGYELTVLGAPEKNTIIRGFDAIAASDQAAVVGAIAVHDLIFTAAGGGNLEEIGRQLAVGLARRLATRGEQGTCNIIICENYKKPALLLRQAIEDHADQRTRRWTRENLGIAETQVLRSCIEPTPQMKRRDPLSLQVQDWWTLPCDAEAFRGRPPEIEGLVLKANFQNELIRKLYTYNCSNAVIGYLGYQRRYTMLHEAANDPEILALAQQAYDETGEALIREFDFDPHEHRQLQQLALTKYRDRRIADPIERNCRDSRRKLSADDRLVGPARLAVKHGIQPHAVCLAIAAALHYEGSDDPGTCHVRQVVKTQGLDAALASICGITRDDPLFEMIIASVPRLADLAGAKRQPVKNQGIAP